MEQILIKVHNVDPNNSEEVKDALSNFIPCLQKYKKLHSHRLLRELQTLINRFPKYCMTHRKNIETFLIIFLSSNNYFTVIEAAKCAHVLQQVRPTQEKTATSRSNWRDQMTLLCNAAHTLIGTVFIDAVDMYNSTDKPQKSSENSPLSAALIEVKKTPKDFKNKDSLLKTRLQNVLVFIQAMLVEIYPVAKPVQTQLVLDVIVRLLTVTSALKQYDADICNIKTQALRTLDSLIVCLGSNLIPYSPLVFRLVLQTLRWSTDNSSNDTSKVRAVAYNSLGLWLTTLRVHIISDSRNTVEDELTNHIITDITPAKKLVQLTIGAQTTRHLSKKAKRKLANTQLQESSLAVYGPGENSKISVSEEVTNEVAIAALECAETFLTVCGRFLKPATHKLFQERLVRECYNYSTYTDKQLLPLLRVLEASRKTTPNNVPPTTQYCLQLYSLLVNSTHSDISKFCSQALLDIRLHLHCSPPSINFALDLPCETEKKSNKRKKISERNRAMLETLLGADKIPTIENEDDVISIPDEMLEKKPRLTDDDVDQISVSSDSVKSVEISDDSEDNHMEIVEVVVEVNESNKENVDFEPTTTQKLNQVEILLPMVISVEPTGAEPDQEASTKKTLELNENLETQEACSENVETEKTEIRPQADFISIHEAQTQIQLNASNNAIEDDNEKSLEVGYGYPNTDTEKIPVLDKIDDENLPSSNDTDDIQITCGQVVRDSQEIDLENKHDDAEPKPHEITKVNGIANAIVENGVSEETLPTSNENEIVKSSFKDDATSVEDMLADFVDEVNEEAVET